MTDSDLNNGLVGRSSQPLKKVCDIQLRETLQLRSPERSDQHQRRRHQVNRTSAILLGQRYKEHTSHRQPDEHNRHHLVELRIADLEVHDHQLPEDRLDAESVPDVSAVIQWLEKKAYAVKIRHVTARTSVKLTVLRSVLQFYLVSTDWRMNGRHGTYQRLIGIF